MPAFSSKSRPIPAGDLVYGPTGEPFAWLGRRDCDAAGRQLTETGRLGVVVVLGCPGEDAGHTEAIGATIAGILARLRPDVTMTPLPTVAS